MKEAGQALCFFPAVSLLLFRNFVADAPQNYAGMIAVAAHHVAQVPFRPLVVILTVSVRNLWNAPHVEGFIHDYHSQTMAVSDDRKPRRIVAGPTVVNTRRLH